MHINRYKLNVTTNFQKSYKMATPSKKVAPTPGSEEEINIHGYVHAVSQIKISKRNNRVKFFNIEVQQAPDSFRNGVIFAPEKRSSFLNACENGHGVDIRRVRKTLSWRDPQQWDIKGGPNTYLVMKTLGFTQTPRKESPFVDLQTAKEMPCYSSVNITVKVVKENETEFITGWAGKPTPIKELVVADATAQMNLKVWDEQIPYILMGESYKLKHIKIREYGKKYLTTSKDSHITPCSSIGDVCSSDGDDDAFTAKINLVNISIKKVCQNCKKPMPVSEKKSVFVRCSVCNMKQMETDLATRLSSDVVFAGLDEKYSINTDVLSNFLASVEQQHLLQNTEELEEYFLTCGPLSVHPNGTLVYKIRLSSGKDAAGKGAAGKGAAGKGAAGKSAAGKGAAGKGAAGKDAAGKGAAGKGAADMS